MLGDRERTQLQETGELTIDPRVSVYEIVDLLSDLGLTLGDDAHLVECMTNYGLGFRLTTRPASPQPDPTTRLSEGTGDALPPCDESCKSRCRGSERICDDHHDRRIDCPGCRDCLPPGATTQKPQDEEER